MEQQIVEDKFYELARKSEKEAIKWLFDFLFKKWSDEDGHYSAERIVEFFSSVLLNYSLKLHNGNTTYAAEYLKLNRTTVAAMIKRGLCTKTP
jgi:hypothetical protein